MWKNVCLNNYDLVTAQVVCKELGCGTALRVYNMSSTANETEKIRLHCLDGETPSDKCVQPMCSKYSEDAAVECSGKMLFIISQHLGGPEILHDGFCTVFYLFILLFTKLSVTST